MKIPFTKFELNINNLKENILPTETKTTEQNIFDKHFIPFEQTLLRINQNIQTWRYGLVYAEDYNNPNRTELLRLYKDIELDAQVRACVDSRKNEILSKSFLAVDKDGTPNDFKTKLINNEWFYSFISEALNSIYYGHSLLHFRNLNNFIFDSVELVPRQNTRPEFNLIVKNSTDRNGFDFATEPLNNWFIGVGGKRNLGLFAAVAPFYIFKKNAFSAYAQYNEIFGSPIRVARTNAKGKALESLTGFLKNMSHSGYGILNLDDQIELLESGKADGSGVFLNMIQKCDEQIAKILNGSTSGVDAKAFVGAAQVQERSFKQYIEMDKRFIQNIIKKQLIPLLNKQGFNIDNIIIKQDDNFTPIEKKDMIVSLLPYFNFSAEYIKNTLGIEVQPKEINNDTIQNKLKNFYEL